MSVLKTMQSGEATLTSTSLAVTVASYSVASSILIFSVKGGNSTAIDAMVRGVKTDSTTLTFYRGGDTGTAPTIQWDLLEYDADTDVQDITESGTGTQDTTISTVSTDEAFVISNGMSTSDSALSDTTTAALEVTSSTNVQRRTGNTGGSGTFSYQVVEQTGQHGVQSVQFFNVSGQTGTSFSQTITSVDTDRTLLFGSGRCNDTGGYDYSDPFRLNLSSSTTVASARTGTASWDACFYVVEYSSDVMVQRGEQSVGTDNDITITEVVVQNTVAMCTASHSMGFSHGDNSSASSTGDDAHVKCVVDWEQNLNTQRVGTTGTCTANWQIMEADPDAVSNVSVLDSVSYGYGYDETSFSHTISDADNRVLIVAVATRASALADTAVSCSYNSVAMTQAATVYSGTTDAILRTTIFYLLDASLPSAGSYTVAITSPTGTPLEIAAHAFTLDGVHQSAPTNASYGSEDDETEVSTSITTTSANAFLVDMIAGNGYVGADPGTGQTQQGRTWGTSTVTTSTRPVGLAEDWPMSWTVDGTYDRTVHVVLAFNEATSGTVEYLEGESDGVASVSSAGINSTKLLEGESDGVASASATLDTFVKYMEASSDGAAIVGGVLNTTVHFLGVSDGVATVDGDLPIDVQLVGASDGVATASATIQTVENIEGSSAGSSVVLDATLTIDQGMSGQSDGVATVTGEVNTSWGGARADGYSVVNGQLEVLHGMQVASDGSSIVVANMRIEHGFVGQSDGVTIVEGALNALSEIIPLEGQSGGSSVVVADRSLFQIQVPLLVGVPGQATVVATLAPDRILEAQVDGVATVEGTLEVNAQLVANADGIATVAGDLGVLTNLVVSVAGYSTVQGSLDGAIKAVSGYSNGEATVTTALEVATALEAVVAGAATVAGDLLVQTALEGLSEGLTNVTSQIEMVRGQAGQSDGAATVLATLATLRGVEAAIAGAASVEGVVDVHKALQVAVSGVATVLASLEQDVPLSAQTDGVALVAGALNVLTTLEAVASGAASTEAELTKTVPIEGQADGLTTVEADMLNHVWHEAVVNGTTTVDAALEVATALWGLVQGDSVPVAALEVATALIGESLGLSTPSGRLAITGLALDPVSVRGRARVSGTLSLIQITGGHFEKNDPRIITRTI